MPNRSLDDVLSELIEERHPPMIELVTAIAREPFAELLGCDLSMLRLWLGRSRSDKRHDLMVTYADGRGGGRPTPPFVESFELTFFGDGHPTQRTADLDGTIRAIREWYDAVTSGVTGAQFHRDHR